MTDHFSSKIRRAATLLRGIPAIHTGTVHAQDTSHIPMMATHEEQDVTFRFQVPEFAEQLRDTMAPWVNLPWAEEHFQERVSGIPHNPAPSHVRWPWARHNGRHQDGDGMFSHTYPERMWPKYAGGDHEYRLPTGEHATANWGIRFAYGDLNDMVDLMVRQPLTRQAYLPIWFPEDTGAVNGQRVPCTLGYHFMIRDHRLSCRYYLRSCDLIRHFADDVYMAARLMQWVADQWKERVTLASMSLNPDVTNWSSPPLFPGRLTVHIASLHAFVGDDYRLKAMAEGEDAWNARHANRR